MYRKLDRKAIKLRYPCTWVGFSSYFCVILQVLNTYDDGMNFIATLVLLIGISAGSSYFYRQHAARIKPQPDGTVRAKLPGWYIAFGYFLIAAGVFLAFASLILSSGSNPMPLNMAIGFPAMTFGLGIVTILMGQRQYIETGVDYIERRAWYGKVTRIPFHEIDSYSYSPAGLGGWLVLKAADRRRIAFNSRFLRGERVIAALAFRQINGRWPSPYNQEEQRVLGEESSLRAAQQYLAKTPKARGLRR